jgi:hypothetical protein
MFVEFVAPKVTPTDINTSSGIASRGGVPLIAALPALDGVDYITFLWHLTQTGGTTKFTLQCALSIDGPWIDMHTVTSLNASDSGFKQLPKAPLWRLFFDTTSIGTALVLTAGVVG